MFVYYRVIMRSLIMTGVFAGLAGIVAWIDPWSNGVPWVNWFSVTIAITISVMIGAVITTTSVEEEHFWTGIGGTLVSWFLLGGLIFGIFVMNALDPRYYSLAWTFFGIPFVAVPVSAMVNYLAEARQPLNEEQQLRRVA